ncbi:MAG: sigma-70 family RNA polymerase sigma factor [Planctomycetota bacterium]|nr:sigma-70 family RNA polymerase sigma factor [Planctomycetota bacterium]
MEGELLKGEGDRFLLDEMRKGSSIAFRRLVERFGGRLKAFAARRLSGSGIDPEDAVQETFLSLVRNLSQLHEVRSLQAYLFTILRCRIADLARARGPTASAISLNANGSWPGVQPTSAEESPSTYARRDEAVGARRAVLADVLEILLGRLKSDGRFRDLKVLELIFCKGTSHQDAARLAGTSEPTVSRTRKATVEELRKLAAAHPQADALQDIPWGDDVSGLIRTVWEENLFTCVKRNTLGSYALEVLDAEWTDFVRFHLDVFGCEYCKAHLSDLSKPEAGVSQKMRDQIFHSSAGFLK